MSNYISVISGLFQGIISSLNSVGNHIESYPVILVIITVWVSVAAVTWVIRLANN